MKRGTLIVLGAIALVALLIYWNFTGTYNAIVEKDEAANSAWGEVMTSYQRRFDLLPNLIETVKGVSKFEQGTLTAVVEARAKVGSMQITPEVLKDEAAMKAFTQNQAALQSSISRLLVVSEQYPELKSNQSFRDLMVELSGTENRVKRARDVFGEAVKDYNTYIRRFPNSLYASMFGFSKKAYFEAEAGAEKAPKVKF
jgi:LemA protein